MVRIVDKIVKEYHLNENDLFLVEYIVANSEEVIKLSSHQLAKKVYCSPTAVVRFVKKIGFDSYSDFKINLHSFLNKYYLQEMEILSNENLLSIKNKLAKIENETINQTQAMISIDTLKQAMTLISKNQYLDIIAYDANASISDYASHLLCSLGKFVQVYHNYDKQLWLALNANSDHTIIIVSKYGRNEHLLKVIDILIKKKIPVIVITSKHQSELAKKPVIFLYGIIHDEFVSLKDMIFYISVKYIFDLFYSVLISDNLNRATKLDEFFGNIFNNNKK